MVAGYGFVMCYEKAHHFAAVHVLLLLSLFLPVVVSLHLASLTWHDDSRAQARRWIEDNIPAGAKIIVNADRTRLSMTPQAVAEHRTLDPAAIRAVDLAEEMFGGNPKYRSFHALNLNFVGDQNILKNIEQYARTNNYVYLLTGDDYFDEQRAPIRPLADSGVLLRSFGKTNKDYSVASSVFVGYPFNFLRLRELGPAVSVYKLRQ